MIYPLLGRLNMAVEHRARAAPTHLVPGPVDFKPFCGALFSAAQFISHRWIKNFRPASGKRTQPGLTQNPQGFGDRSFENTSRYMADFDRGKRLQLKVRIKRAQASEEIQ